MHPSMRFSFSVSMSFASLSIWIVSFLSIRPSVCSYDRILSENTQNRRMIEENAHSIFDYLFRFMSVSKSNLEQQIVTPYGWHVRFDVRFDPEWKPFSRPRAKQLVEYVPLFMRYNDPITSRGVLSDTDVHLSDIFVFGTSWRERNDVPTWISWILCLCNRSMVSYRVKVGDCSLWNFLRCTARWFGFGNDWSRISRRILSLSVGAGSLWVSHRRSEHCRLHFVLVDQPKHCFSHSHWIVHGLYSSSKHDNLLSSSDTESASKERIESMEQRFSKGKWKVSSSVSSILDNLRFTRSKCSVAVQTIITCDSTQLSSTIQSNCGQKRGSHFVGFIVARGLLSLVHWKSQRRTGWSQSDVHMASGFRSVNVCLWRRSTKVIILLASREFSCHDVSHTRVTLAEDEWEAAGVSIKQVLREMKLEYCVMGKKEVCSDWSMTLTNRFFLESF